jgi:predicted transcriptional regulator
MPKKIISIRIDPAAKDALDDLAEMDNLTVSQIIRQLIEKYIGFRRGLLVQSEGTENDLSKAANHTASQAADVGMPFNESLLDSVAEEVNQDEN